MRLLRTGLLSSAVLAICAPGSASSADPLGFYVGAAVGQADVRANEVAFATPQGTDGVPLGFREHDTGWKVLIGLRPISLVGAELEYVDFGHPSGLAPFFGTALRIQGDARAKAAKISGLLYLPVPLPLVDFYGKVGLARLQTKVNAEIVCVGGGCPPTRPFGPFALSETDTRFAYGAGAQVKLSALAVRLEYERISATGGDPDLLSLGLTWTF